MSTVNTIVLLGTLTGILLFVGWVFAGFGGMIVAFILALLINFFSYWFSDKIVLRIYGAKPTNDKFLNEAVEQIAFEAKIPKPRVYTIKSHIMNAFATGRNPKNSVVVVTEGLMKLEKDEIEGVLAHELGHIRNRDVLVSTIAAVIGGTIAYIAQMTYWSMFMQGGKREGNLVGLILIVIFAPLAALLVRLAISRTREYKADFTGALLTKRPRALASALRKIEKGAKEHPVHGSAASSHLWIVNPFRQDWFTGLFSTHPPIEERVSRLDNMGSKLKELGGSTEGVK